ncbi:MAG: molybdopterin oxidoreductase family protein, partial [Pseudomonadota bacterium]
LAEALGGTANRKTPRETLDAGLRHGPHGLTLEAVEAAPHGIDLGPHEPRLPGRLATPDKRIHTAPPLCLEDLARFRAELATAGDPATLLLIGRRHVRSNNSWLHNSKRLVKGPDRCTVMMHPDDARARNIGEGAAVEVASRVGTVTLPVEITADMMPGTVSIPHGWGHGRTGVKLSVAADHAGASINDLTDPARMDPLTGNAAFNGTPVTVAPAEMLAAAE